MTSQRMVEPGVVLADRYRIEDLIAERAGTRSWRAFDSALNRSVGIQALPEDDPRAAGFLAAARQAATVADPRFVRVLDAVEGEYDLVYIVREWARAVSLEVLLREGPLGNRRAADVVGEVAAAVAAAHESGMYHRRLDLSAVLVKDNGAVRILGLGTAHALANRSGAEPESGVAASQGAERVDVTAIGKIFYACLVARWPGGRDFGLSAAPTEHGRLLRPRQVRAGVSRTADRICDRILGSPPAHHEPPLRTAREIADELALVGEDEITTFDDSSPSGSGTSSGLLPRVPGGTLGPPPAVVETRPPRVVAPEPLSPLQRSRQAARSATEGGRALIWLGIALLVAVAASVAFFVGRTTVAAPTGGRSTDDAPSVTAAPRPLPIASATDLDPPPRGNLSENPELAPNAIDGDPATEWHTLSYQNQLEWGGLKEGVGLVLDLRTVRQVGEVRVRFGTGEHAFEVYTAPASEEEPPARIAELALMGQVSSSEEGGIATVQGDPPPSTRYVVVWLTEIPPDPVAPTTDEGVVYEIEVLGWTP